MRIIAALFFLYSSLLWGRDKVEPQQSQIRAPEESSAKTSSQDRETAGGDLSKTETLSEPLHCNSYQTYRNTVEYLKTQKELSFTEPQILKAALDINSGCDGADKRFKKVFELLLKSGVYIKKAYELAVDFSKMSDQKTDSFVVLFRGLFLENKFDFDFTSAYRISLELSAAYPKDWEKLQIDFKKFLEYCKQSNVEELPVRICADWTLKLLKHEPLYESGIYSSFNSLNTYLLKKEGPQLPVRDRLRLISEVISYGPKASNNFIQALDWLRNPRGAGLKPQKAHQLALKIAQNSMKNDEPLFDKSKIPKDK